MMIITIFVLIFVSSKTRIDKERISIKSSSIRIRNLSRNTIHGYFYIHLSRKCIFGGKVFPFNCVLTLAEILACLHYLTSNRFHILLKDLGETFAVKRLERIF